MQYFDTSLLRYALPIGVLGLGAMFLIPGEDAPARAGTVTQVEATAQPSYLAASPEMIAALQASLAPPVVEEDVVVREASLPDPSAVRGVSTPVVAPATATVAKAEETTKDPAAAIRVGDVAVNMRSGPSTGTAVVRTLKPGEDLILGETSGGWAAVTTEGGDQGWVYATYLTGPAIASAIPSSEPRREVASRNGREQTAPSGNQRFARVASDVYLRAGPSKSTDRLFVLPAGERVAVAEMRGGWARVVLPSGASGWVRVR